MKYHIFPRRILDLTFINRVKNPYYFIIKKKTLAIIAPSKLF